MRLPKDISLSLIIEVGFCQDRRKRRVHYKEKRNNMKFFISFIISLYFISFCQSQNIQYRSKIRPNVKAKLDSLYPHASGIILEQAIISDTTQTIAFGCNCAETIGAI